MKTMTHCPIYINFLRNMVAFHWPRAEERAKRVRPRLLPELSAVTGIRLTH